MALCGILRTKPIKLSNLLRLRIVIAITLPTAAVMAQAQLGSSKPIVQIIDPATVNPLIGAAPWNANGPAAHRRVVTHGDNGAVYLDMGYNTYKKGVRLSTPYAYKTDEICFVPVGRARMQNESAPFETDPSHMMWRPSGGVTHWVEFLEDSVTICSMAPARLDADSHRIPPADVDKWYGDPASKPFPRWFPIAGGPVVTALDKSASAGVVEHEVLSLRKDGSAKVSVIYTTFETGSHVAADSKGEQICWVGAGTLKLSTGGETMIAPSHNFFYRPEGARIDRIEATKPATMTCFSGPAAL